MVNRLIDYSIVTLLMPLVLTLGLIIAVVIWIEGLGPVLYRSRRIGCGGKEFHMLKFRTMYPDGDKRLTAEHRDILLRDFKLTGDPRITPVGHWLRCTSLDELPQFINVLRNEMSIIGPRPKLPDEVNLYGTLKDELLSIRPGITGYWQVFRTDSKSDETMRKMDIFYIRNRNVIMDIKILILSPLVVFRRQNH